jgi:hypothetical protein
VKLSEAFTSDFGVQHDQLHLAGRVRVNVVDGVDVAPVGVNFFRRQFGEIARQLSAVFYDGVAAELSSILSDFYRRH